MAFSGSQDSHETSLLSEINITPMVDVMLVLLIIFMITSSAETVERMKKEKEKENLQQKVPIDLPKVNAEPVVQAEEKKIVLTINQELKFYIGDTEILDCGKERPGLLKEIQGRDLLKICDEADPRLKVCLNGLEQKLKHNEKLKQDQEIYLRADKKIPYGCALMAMSRIRKAGIVKFGLIAESEE